MKIKECHLIQELLPLYGENLINKETAEYIEEHLAGCISCTQEWESFIKPLPDPLLGEKMTPPNSTENKLLKRVKKTVAAAVLLLVMGGTGLAYASYTAGKHVGQDDPSYRFAQELDLFTEINQSKTVDGIQVNIDNGLFDSTRSVIFMNFSSPVKDIPQLSLTDDAGEQYEQKRSRGWQNKYFMFELEPLDTATQSINVSLALVDPEGKDTSDTAEFKIPVDVLKTAQYTKIIYPNQERDLSKLKIHLEKAVLGVSESEFEVRFDWPVDGTVAGIGIGRGTAYFPTSVIEVPDTTPPPGAPAPPPGGLMSSYAASYGVNYRKEDPPQNRPALYDLAGRQEVEVQGAEYRTTQFPCQVTALLKFAPVERETEELELLLPPVYLYEKAANAPKLQVNFQESNELNLEKSILIEGGKVVLEKIWLEKNSLYISYRMEFSDNQDTILPHFKLTDIEGMKQGEPRFDREKPQVIIFHLYNEEIEELFLNLDSIGHLLPREKFTLHL